MTTQPPDLLATWPIQAVQQLAKECYTQFFTLKGAPLGQP